METHFLYDFPVALKSRISWMDLHFSHQQFFLTAALIILRISPRQEQVK